MLVFLHGLGSRGPSLAPLQEMLKPRFETYLPTRRPLGHQASYEDIFANVVRDLDERGIGPAFYLGYSFGGHIAFTLARRFPERVRGVIGVASPLFFNGRALSRIRQVLKEELAARGRGDQRRETIEQRWGADFEDVVAGTERMFLQMRENPPLSRADVAAIEAPALYLSGDHDHYVPADVAKATAELLPNARLGLFPGLGHPISNVPVVQVKHAVTTFIDQVEAGSFDPKVPADVTARLVVGGLAFHDVTAKLKQARRQNAGS
jgi:pimeloyl-ACP methyl ester carboxylesterase